MDKLTCETSRELILRMCLEKPLRMVDLENALKISRGALRHHLNVLEKEGKIEPMQRDITKHGRPTSIILTPTAKQTISLEKKQSQENLKLLLSKIKQRPNLNHFDVIPRGEFSEKTLTIEYLLRQATADGLIDVTYNLTPKGKEFLEQSREDS